MHFSKLLIHQDYFFSYKITLIMKDVWFMPVIALALNMPNYNLLKHSVIFSFIIPAQLLPLCWGNINSAVTCDFQQCGILTSVDSEEHVQPPFKPRNSK